MEEHGRKGIDMEGCKKMTAFNTDEELHRYVDHLFRKYQPTKQIQELRAEILSNLEAKVADLTASGMDYRDAVQQAKDSIRSIDNLVDGHPVIYMNRFFLELFQRGLLYCLIAWILTIPLRIVGLGIVTNLILMALSVVGSIAYFAMYFIFHDGDRAKLHVKKTVDCHFVEQLTKTSWLIWALFIVVMTLTTTAAQFGSNLWFARPVQIDGPYQFGVLVIRYALPFVSMIVPLMFQASHKLISKHAVGENDE